MVLHSTPDRRSAFTLLILTLLTPAAAVASPNPNEVGDLGAPSALEFEGLVTYPPDQIRDELEHDMNVQVASAPTAPLADYLALLQKRLLVGFQNGGFPQAKVDVSADHARGAVVVKVAEGARYRGGAVKVSGGKSVAKDKLVAL